MKFKFVLLGLAALLLPAFHSLRADTLFKDLHIGVSGSIIQETGTSGQTSVKPLTIANVLSVLGLSSTAGPLAYFYDQTTGGYVIAPKSTMSSFSGTPIIDVFTPGNSVSWDPSRHSYISALAITGFDGDLAGTAEVKGVIPHSVETDADTFVEFGTISGIPTIVKGKVTDIYHLAP